MVSERDSKAEDPAPADASVGQPSRQATLRAVSAAQIDGSHRIESDDDPAAAAGPTAGPAQRSKGRGRLTGWLVVAVPAVTSFVVGGYEIGGPSFWRDEAYTKDAIARPVGQIFTLLGHTDAVHGAYYLLMHAVASAIGSSATALRFPSLCAMVVATACTAAIGRRTAALAQQANSADRSRLNVPALTGFLSGMVFATAPYMTYYAQTARSYAIVTMFATIASYLLLRAYPDGRWRWWSAYAVAAALTGLFNLFSLLILAAHGVTLLLTDARGREGRGRWIGRVPLRWLAACDAALIVLGPLLRVAGGQQEQIAWLTRPNFKTIYRLMHDFAGSKELLVSFALLVLVGLVVACLADNWRPLNPVAIALPWLVVPPLLLIAVSYEKPVYYERYVEFCLPALAILVGAGLTGIVRLASAAPVRRLRVTRLASAIVAAHEQPGDVVFYLPLDAHVLGTGYPAPFERLRDIALARSPIASGTLTGTEITSPAVLKSRFTDVRRVWVVTGASNYKFPVPSTPLDQEKMALIAGAGMHIIHRWLAGEVMLTLYGT